MTFLRYLLKEKSFWWPYIKSLPQPSELSIPSLWSQRDQAFFNGTNVEPALSKRQVLWQFEYEQALSHFSKQSGDWQDYTLDIYKWAAVIFGSRSFRPSLTISPSLFDEEIEDGKGDLIKSHISNDTFSVLYPVLDIGNHNAADRMRWTHGDHSFSLSSMRDFQAGEQVYNFYGNKSNSELLVGYGFLLEDDALDRVNIKLNNLPQEVKDYRRTQSNHILPSPNQPEEEFMYFVGQSNHQEESRVLPYLSQGLLDSVIYLVANDRERNHIRHQTNWCPEQDQEIFVGELNRCAHVARHIIEEKVQAELERLVATDPGYVVLHLRKFQFKKDLTAFSPPQKPYQEVATTYRHRTKVLLNHALTQLQAIPSPGLLSLETAYTWLCQHIPHVYSKLEQYIADDQEETLPLKWDVFIEDWDHTYLLIWIYIILSQQLSDPEFFPESHIVFNENWLKPVSELADNSKLYAEQGEIDTIDGTIEFVAGLFGHREDESVRLRNMASHILKVESVRGLLRAPGQPVQEMLCIPGLQLILDS